MRELSLDLLRAWPGRFRFGELLVRLAEPGEPSGDAASAVLEGIIADQTEQEVLTGMIDGGQFAAATHMLGQCTKLTDEDIRRAHVRLEQSRASHLQMFTEQTRQLSELAEQAGIVVDIDHAALADQFERSWSAAEKRLAAIRRDLRLRVDDHAKELRARLAMTEMPTSGRALFDSLLRDDRLRAADELLRHGSPEALGPETVPRPPQWPWPDTGPAEVLRWHLSPSFTLPPEFARWQARDDTAQRLLHAWDGLQAGGQSAAVNFAAALDAFLAPASDGIEVYPVDGGFMGKLHNVFHDAQVSRISPPGATDLFIGDPTATTPLAFPGVRQFIAVGPSIDGHEYNGRGDCAVLTLRDILRLVAADERRPLSLLRILGRHWQLSAFGCGTPSDLAQRPGTSPAERFQSLCWLTDLIGVGGSAAAAALVFQGDDPRVMHVFLDFLTRTNARIGWKNLNRWRNDKQLAASVETSVLHPIASSPAAMAAFWAALGTATPGSAVTLQDMALTTVLSGLEWDRELRAGLAELSGQWLAEQASPDGVTLRECGALIGLRDLAESRLTGLTSRIAGLAGHAAESTPTAWESYRYALSPSWDDYLAAQEDGSDADVVAVIRRNLVGSPEDFLSGTMDFTGSSDVVAVTAELRTAFTERYPGIALVVESPPAARAGISDQVAYVLLYELLTNAADALPSGGTVAVTIDVSGADVVIDVQDTGPGIAVEVDGHRTFRKGVSTRGPERGLGLWIVRRLVTQQVDGDVQLVAARHGHPVLQGAHFRLTLPVA